MSELKTNLEQILQEKNEKIISQNIKKDIEVLGVTGSYDKEDIKELQDELADAEQELADVRRDLDNSTATVSGSGENITLSGTAEARFKKAPLPLGNTEQEVIEAQAGTTVEGENINASGIDLNKVEILNINGNTKQETTTGKNLLPNNITSQNINGLQVTKNSDGTLLINGTATSQTSLRVATNLTLNSGTYYLSGNIGGSSTTYRLYAPDFPAYDDGTGKQFTLNSQTSSNVILLIFNNVTMSNVLIKPMIEEGSTATSYEPYTGGIASPNSDYPQEIKSVGENINLFDKSLTPFSTVSTSCQTLDTGVRAISTANSSASNTSNTAQFFIGDIQKYIGKTITLSAHAKSSSTNKGFMYLRLCNENKDVTNTYVAQLTGSTLDGDLSVSYTIPSEIGEYHYLKVALYSTRDSAVVKDDYVDYTNLQLKVGSTIQSYSEFGQGNASVVVENKNKLAYPDISSVTFGNITFAHDKGIYTISTDGTSTTPTSTDVYPIENYIIQEGDYIHYNNSFVDSHIGISLRFSDNTNVFNSFASSTNRIISLSNYVGKTITAIGFNWNTGYTFTGTCKPMITNSSTATDYVAHEGQSFTIPTQAPFRKINSIKDTFVKKVDGKWYEKHAIGEVILDGSESNWLLVSSTDDYYEFQCINVLNPKAVSGYTFPISSYFSNLTNNRVVANTDLVLIRVSSVFNITTAQDFKTWLSTHNTIVNYALKEPTYIECTQAQSDILEQINTFYETTNIFSIDEVSPNFTFTYNKVYASPSPDDESPIQTVSGDVEVKVQNENLFDGSKEVNTNFTNSVATALNHFIQTGEYATGYCNNSNQISAYAGVYETCFVPISENTNYHISSQASENNGFSSINILDKNGNLLQSSNNWIGEGYAFTTPSNAKYLMFGTRVINIDYIQLIKGTTSIPLVPHKEQVLPLTLGNIELCKIGNYQDYFYKESNKWYLHKEISKAVLNGSENWLLNSSSNNEYRYWLSNTAFDNKFELMLKGSEQQLRNKLLSNYFVQSIFSNTGIGKFSVNYTAGSRWFLLNVSINDLDDFKTWLSTHNTIVYYELETPTDTEITDTTLISQLEAIRKAISYDEQTNISSNTIALFDIIALRNMNTVLNTLENDVDLLE